MGDSIGPSAVFGSPWVAERHWVLAIAELRALGMTDDRVAGAVAAGHLFRKFLGVYAVGRPVLDLAGRCRAAVLACGPGAAASHISAAALWNLRASTGIVHVSGPRSLAGQPGLRLHRPRSLPPEDVTVRDGVPLTTVARTILDMSPGRSPDQVGGWLHEAGVLRILDFREVLSVLERHPHHRGRRVLTAALEAEVLPTRTGLEDAMLRLWRRARLPRPRVNEHVRSAEGIEEVDFHHPRLRLVAEVDGGRYHASRWRRRRDAAKDERLRAAGWTVLRVPELRVSLRPEAVVADLRAAARRPWAV